MAFEGWRRLALFDGFVLTVHPDLPVSLVEFEGNKAAMLGYAIDPYHPELDERGILRRFVEGRPTINGVADGLNALTGRFVLIVNCEQGSWVFHDGCGLRQVQYCVDKNGRTWCASQPETLAEHFGYAFDEDILSYRNTSHVYKADKEEFWLINERSPYREIKALLPNHYLDIEVGKPYRFWPIPGCIGSLSSEEGVRLSESVLRNTIRAAADRFDLKMGISAGCDSRKSLAASRDVKDRIVFFTHTPRESNEADLEIPQRLLPKLGIKHHKLDLQNMPDDFRECYQQSATWARERRGHIAYTALQHFGPDATVLNSNISEYSQVWFWLPKSKVNGEGLAILKGLNHPVVIREFQKWLDGATDACQKANMNLLVLFDIELRARWVAAAIAEYDIAYETFNPYNNRHFFCLELSVDERIRRGRSLGYPIKLIRNMWPEASHTALGKITEESRPTMSSRSCTMWRHHCFLMFSFSSTPSGP
jgi:hypothetical protein